MFYDIAIVKVGMATNLYNCFESFIKIKSMIEGCRNNNFEKIYKWRKKLYYKYNFGGL
jgi:hypothetical protein